MATEGQHIPPRAAIALRRGMDLDLDPLDLLAPRARSKDAETKWPTHPVNSFKVGSLASERASKQGTPSLLYFFSTLVLVFSYLTLVGCQYRKDNHDLY